MSALPKRRYTLDEYFALERDSSIKHEYLAGEILMMAGSSPEHDRIVGDVQTSLNMQLRGRPCETFTGDMRVRASADSFVYPDLSVVCGEAQFLTVDGVANLLNPIVLIEVTSPSTGHYDRTGKFWRYQMLDSLREYVLIEQGQPIVEIFRHRGDGDWRYTRVEGLDATVALNSIESTLALSEVYRRVSLSGPGEAQS
ncbi:MAG: Uma2 family endonuclease [Chloroflexi bacterium]|nr:Uma2 family endonuclease [Chloroflexota bacterium]